MLHLQTGVHFKEVKAFTAGVRAGYDEFDRARRIIADGPRQSDTLFAHGLAHFGRDKGRWRFFDDLLVPPLDRTFAFVQIQNISMLIAQYLDFDVARVQDEFLDKDAVIAEAVQPFALDRFKTFTDILLAIGKPHPLTAAAGRGFHHHRIADFF